MLRRVMGLFGLATVLSLATGAQTLDDVLAKYYQARGGLAKIEADKSAKITGTMTIGPGAEAPFTWYWARPNKLRMEFTVQGQTGVQAFDGTGGWMYMPFMGKTEPEKLPDEMARNLEDEADLEGQFVNWKAKGNKVELIGKEPVEGTDAYKLKVVNKNGDTTFVYLDADAYLEIKGAGTRMMRGQEMEFESTIGDYKAVDGLMFPFSITSRAKGAPEGQTVTVKSIELNMPVDPSLFVMPEKKAKPTPSPSK